MKAKFLCWANQRWMKPGEHWAVFIDEFSNKFEVVKIGTTHGEVRYQSRARRCSDFKSASAGELSAMRAEDECLP